MTVTPGTIGEIHIDGVTVRYGKTTAVDNLSLRLTGGRVYGLLGRNGAGKSSLLATIAAFRKPTSGTVRIDGEPVFENGRLTSQVCLIREAGDAAEKDESVESALDLAAYLRPQWDDAYAAQLIEQFEIPRKKKVKELSLGKRSALGVTLGLASRAPLTMFDESYLGMDAPSRYAFYDALLADVLQHPRTIVISTHLIEEIGSLFEQVVIIDQGRLLLQEDADTLRERGATITGEANEVHRLLQANPALRVLTSKELGRTRAVTVYGEITAATRRTAETTGLTLEPLPLQDLFVHLTGRTDPAPAHLIGQNDVGHLVGAR